MDNTETSYQKLAAALAGKFKANWQTIRVAAPVLPTRCGGISIRYSDASGIEGDVSPDMELVTLIDESFLAIRDEISAKSKKLVWGIDFCLHPTGHFSAEYSFEKPAWFDDPDPSEEQYALNVDLALLGVHSTPELDDEHERAAMSWLQDVTAKNSVSWGLGSESNWAIDVPAGLITWVFNENRTTTAKVQFIGTWKQSSSEFQWAWANPSIPERWQEAAKALREASRANESGEFNQPRVVTTEARAWAWTAMAGRMTHAQGAYRVSSDGVWIYLIFNELQ